MTDSGFHINFDETFERLPNAPIAEAVIDWRAQPAQKLDARAFLPSLQERLPEYPVVQPQHELTVNHQVGPKGSNLSQTQTWQAFQLQSSDNRYVARFGRSGLAVSRLAPYDCWNAFHDEALRLWGIFVDLAKPPEVQRVGLRYINLLKADNIEEFNRLLTGPVRFPGEIELPLSQFLHQERFDVPRRNYGLNLIRMVQPAPQQADHALNLIVDIDVFTTSENVEEWETNLDTILRELRWIKNKVFFGVFTEQALSQFRE